MITNPASIVCTAHTVANNPLARAGSCRAQCVGVVSAVSLNVHRAFFGSSICKTIRRGPETMPSPAHRGIRKFPSVSAPSMTRAVLPYGVLLPEFPCDCVCTLQAPLSQLHRSTLAPSPAPHRALTHFLPSTHNRTHQLHVHAAHIPPLQAAVPSLSCLISSSESQSSAITTATHTPAKRLHLPCPPRSPSQAYHTRMFSRYVKPAGCGIHWCTYLLDG